MKINILSPGRFHVLDLARELDKNGFDVKFYSFVPTKRAVSFGLPAHCSASLILPMLPFLALQKIFCGQQWAAQLRMWVQDRMTAWLMRKCDVLIAMSGDFIVAPRKAKRQGSKVIIERGSKHILVQKRILESIPSNAGKKPVPDANVRRELACYELADYISIASEHVRRSFVEEGFDVNKLFVNPYGVNLKDFYPMPSAKKVYDVIMVGGWCYQKGCDLIVDAIKAMNLRFLHVGALVDLPFPQGDSRFTHVDAVEQSRLEEYYAQSKVFVFPSRQDGFGMVLSQAVACNLPIAGSKDCGASDLQGMVELPEYIKLIDDYTPESVTKALKEVLKAYEQMNGKVYAGEAISRLTWESYGKRYAAFLDKMGGGNLKVLHLIRKYDVIMVGGWSYRKGCDLILDAIKAMNLRFLHVGALVDLPFPQGDSMFSHVDAVEQRQLVGFYHRARVFLLPSREEGLAMVQAQAIACNLPVVGSPDSGAEDLQKMVAKPEFITLIRSFDTDSVKAALTEALEKADRLVHNRYAGHAIDGLTWEAYGKRYTQFLNSL